MTNRAHVTLNMALTSPKSEDRRRDVAAALRYAANVIEKDELGPDGILPVLWSHEHLSGLLGHSFTRLGTVNVNIPLKEGK